MLMPSIFSRDLFDDMFDARFYGRQQGDLMKTDVKETENEYKLSVDLPGVKKDDLKAQLKDGYLTISATVNPVSYTHLDVYKRQGIYRSQTGFWPPAMTDQYPYSSPRSLRPAMQYNIC